MSVQEVADLMLALGELLPPDVTTGELLRRLGFDAPALRGWSVDLCGSGRAAGHFASGLALGYALSMERERLEELLGEER